MNGTPQLIAKLLYGCGLRISEAIRLRVQDIDSKMKIFTVRSGKGNKDRETTFIDLSTTMTYTSVLQQVGQGVPKLSLAVGIHSRCNRLYSK